MSTITIEPEHSQQQVNKKNQNYWNELCGTHLAKQLGVTDSSHESLEKFDNYYFNFYPYLKKHLYLNEISNKKVLEVGLGYGTVGQLLAKHGAHYHGLDIAENPVKMMQHRLAQNQLLGQAQSASMLDCPFPDNYFDYVISIGCFHHTGNCQGCIDQVYRILKPGGKAMIMLYNKFSLRQWVLWPALTTKAFLHQNGFLKNKVHVTESQRKAYDASADSGAAAPETEFFSITDVKKIFKQFHHTTAIRENFDGIPLKFLSKIGISLGQRDKYLDSFWARKLGLDLYIHAIK